MNLRSLGLAALSASLAIAADIPPAQLIASIQKRAIPSFQSPPNCVCRETIERTPGTPLQVEVALIEGKEQYSWPGSRKFDDASLEALIQAGAVSTGAYSAHPRNLLLRRGAKFQYKGQEEVGGHKAHRFDFTVAGESSTLTVTDGRKKYVIAYHGSLWADAGSYDLLRVETVADEIPEESAITSAEDRIDYHQVELGDEEFTLPKTVELKMSTKKQNFHSTVRFEQCRSFSAEMVAGLVNDESADNQEEKKPVEQEVVRAAPSRKPAAVAKAAPAPPVAPVAAALKPNVEVPPELRLSAGLTTAIRSEAGIRVGDPVTMTLADPLVSRATVLFPAGSRITGNVAVMEKHRSQIFEFYVIGLRFDWIVNGDSRAAFSAELEDVRLAPEGYAFLPYNHLALQESTAWNGVRLDLNPPRYNEGVIWVRGSTLVLPEGMRMVWKTTRPKFR